MKEKGNSDPHAKWINVGLMVAEILGRAVMCADLALGGTGTGTPCSLKRLKKRVR